MDEIFAPCLGKRAITASYIFPFLKSWERGQLISQTDLSLIHISEPTRH